MARRTFDDILDKIEREANEHGEEKDLARLRAHFRLGRRLAQRRLELGLSHGKLVGPEAAARRLSAAISMPTYFRRRK